MGLQDYWELIGAGLDAGLMLILYRVYQAKVKEANLVKEASLYAVGPELERALKDAPENILPYVCVEGVTRAIGKPLRSHYHDNEEGVIQHLLYVEHKSKRTQGYWRDKRRVLKDQLNIRGFEIADKDQPDSPMAVRVTSPLSGRLLMENLTLTYDHFEAHKSGFFSSLLDRLYGEMNKGVQETEKMLSLGVPFLGVGRIRLDGGSAIIESPSGGHDYILTTLSRSGVVKALKARAFNYKIAICVLGVVGAGMVGFWYYRRYVEPSRREE